MNVRPSSDFLGINHSVDASIQVHHDIDRRNKNLGGDEDDD